MPVDLENIFDNLHWLDKDQQKIIRKLQNHNKMFDGTLGQCKGSPNKVELQDKVKPYHTCPYAIPQAYKQMFKEEVKRLDTTLAPWGKNFNTKKGQKILIHL